MDYSLPDHSVQGIFQARILEWVVVSFSRTRERRGLILCPELRLQGYKEEMGSEKARVNKLGNKSSRLS